jgi:hyperosmotically inducible protein
MHFRSALIAASIVVAAGCSAQQQQASTASARDGLIAAGVTAKLSGIDLDAATSVKVGVRNGAVTLRGAAKDAATRDAYDRAARTVSGVTSVTDDLRIDRRIRGAKEGLNDAALTAKTAAMLTAQTGVNALRVKPSAHDGVVTLSGTVDSTAIKATMLATVRRLNGVKAVVDRLTVASK